MKKFIAKAAIARHLSILPILLIGVQTITSCSSSSGGSSSSSGPSNGESSSSGSSSSSIESSSSSNPSSPSASLCGSEPYDPATQFCDTRDSKIYKWKLIGTQTWMAQNLNYPASGSKCYDDISAYCKKYGRLYNWATAMRVCPSGWHLPSNKDWEILINHTGGKKKAGTKLKARSGWKDWDLFLIDHTVYSGNGTDAYGFSALPGGGYDGGGFNGVGLYGLWWSASENNANDAYFRDIFHNAEYAAWMINDKSYGRSVRCLQD